MGTGAELVLPELIGAELLAAEFAVPTLFEASSAFGGLGALGGAEAAMGIDAGAGMFGGSFGGPAIGEAGFGLSSIFPEVGNPLQMSEMMQAGNSVGMSPSELFTPQGAFQPQNLMQGINPMDSVGLSNALSPELMQNPMLNEFGHAGDMYGNFDMGSGMSGTQGFTGGPFAQLPGPGPMDQLGDYLQTPKGMLQTGSLLANMLQTRSSDKMTRQMMEQYSQAQRQAQANQFPFQNYFGEYQNFMNNPTSYMEQKSPGYLASMNFVDQAQKRQNAGSGFNKAGYGDALRATVLGENADKWYKSTGNQLGQAAGVQFSPASSFATTAGSLPYLLNQRNRNQGNSGEFFKGLGNIFTDSGIAKP